MHASGSHVIVRVGSCTPDTYCDPEEEARGIVKGFPIRQDLSAYSHYPFEVIRRRLSVMRDTCEECETSGR